MSQQIDRLIVSRGPALCTYRGGFFFSSADIVVQLDKATKPIPSSAFGPLTEVNQGVKATAKFRPVGEFEHLGILWPYATTRPGSSIFGDADYPLLIQPLDPDQPQVTFKAAGISKQPDLDFTAIDTLMSDVEFQMVGANNVAVDDAARLFVFEDNTIDPDTLPYDPDALIIQAYNNRWLSGGTTEFHYGANGTAAEVVDITAADLETALNALASVIAGGGLDVTGDSTSGWKVTWRTNGARTAITGVLADMPGGTSLREDISVIGDGTHAQVSTLRLFPWGNFQSRAGMKVAFALTLTEDTSDAIGHYDTIFSGLSVTASGMPQGVTDVAALAAAAVQGASSVRGKRLDVGAHDLDIFGDGVFFRLYAANLRKSGQVFSSTNQRVPDLEWVASRSIGAGGVINPLFYIGAAAPA
jgi:hypothetical protein